MIKCHKIWNIRKHDLSQKLIYLTVCAYKKYLKVWNFTKDKLSVKIKFWKEDKTQKFEFQKLLNVKKKCNTKNY